MARAATPKKPPAATPKPTVSRRRPSAASAKGAKSAPSTAKPSKAPAATPAKPKRTAPKRAPPKVNPVVKPKRAAPKVTPVVKPKRAAPKVTPVVKPAEKPKRAAPKVTPAVKPKRAAPKVTPAVKPKRAAPKRAAPIAPAVTPEGLDLSRYGQLVSAPPFCFPHDGLNDLPFPDFPDPLGLGARAIAACGMFRIPEGRNAGRPFDKCLMPWQRALLIALFGHVDTKTGTRVINEVFLLIARKNGKSYFSALIAILEMLSGREPNAEIVVLAATIAQSRIIFTAIRKILESAPRVAQLCRLQDHLHRISYKGPSGQQATIIVASTAKPEALHGKSVSLLLVDELHALRGERGMRAYSALKTSMGARKAPRIIVTTTQSEDPAALNTGEVFREMYDRALSVYHGKTQDGRFLPALFMPASQDDWTDEHVWHRVNPGIAGGILSIDELREEYMRAKESILLSNAFKCLRLNMEPLNASGQTWLEPSAVDAVTDDVEWDEIKACDHKIVGIDLASVDDICSAVVLGIQSTGDKERYIARGIHALGGAAYNRYSKDTPALRYLDSDGDLTIWPDDGVLLDVFADDVIDLCAELDCKHVAMDPAMASLVTKRLEDAGLVVLHVRQGTISMTPALAWVEMQMLSKNLRVHAGTIPFCLKNALVVRRGESRGLTRENAYTGKKIDAAMALLDAVVVHLSGSTAGGFDVEAFII